MRPNIILFIILSATITACGCGDRLPNDGSLIFSHSVHLAQPGIDCLNCHTSIPASASAGDNNLPKEAACLACHTESVDTPSHECSTCHVNPDQARTLANRERAIKFPHEKHVIMSYLPMVLTGAMDAGRYPVDVSAIRPLIKEDGRVCDACHRGIAQADFTTSANRPMMSDCLVCHGSTPPEETCNFCHEESFDRFPATHKTSTFYDDHPTIKEENPSLCQQCHSQEKNNCTQCH
jgi:hypothetical protein